MQLKFLKLIIVLLCLVSCNKKSLIRLKLQEDNKNLVLKIINNSQKDVCIYSNFLDGISFFNEKDEKEIGNKNYWIELSLEKPTIIKKNSEIAIRYPKYFFETLSKDSTKYAYEIETFPCVSEPYIEAKIKKSEILIKSKKLYPIE